MRDNKKPNKEELLRSQNRDLIKRELKLVEDLEQPLETEHEEKMFEELIKECDFHYKLENFLKSKKDFLDFLFGDLYIHAQIMEVDHHVALKALMYWTKKNHPNGHKIYSLFIHELSKIEKS
jgi:hypothetical protein